MPQPIAEPPEVKRPGFVPGTRAHLLYNLALKGALLLSCPAWIPWVALSRKRRRNFPQRLGAGLEDVVGVRHDRTRIWLHAVSVGETLSAVSLVRALGKEVPQAEIFVSTVTLTGQDVARTAFRDRIEGTFYFPFDLPGVAGRFLERVGPDVVVLLETEIWPNFLAECAGRGIPVVIVNGRISERSFRRYGRVKPLFARVLDCVSAVAMQTDEDARRIVALGADAERVAVTGNMKFDVPPRSEGPSALCTWMQEERARGARWVVAGSTHEGEEEAVLGAFRDARAKDRSIRLLLAPRHPERFDSVMELCGRLGWDTARRTRFPPSGGSSAPVVVLDTVGELSDAFAAADIAFVGGSLVAKGGHNVLEPARFGAPVVVGPHMENFRDIAERFRAGDAIVTVRDAAALREMLAGWAVDPGRFAVIGERGRRLLEGLRGATARNAALIRREMSLRREVCP